MKVFVSMTEKLACMIYDLQLFLMQYQNHKKDQWRAQDLF